MLAIKLGAWEVDMLVPDFIGPERAGPQTGRQRNTWQNLQMAQELGVPGTSGSGTKVRLKTGVLFGGLCGVPGPCCWFAEQVPTLPLPRQKTGGSFAREGKCISRLKGPTQHPA